MTPPFPATEIEWHSDGVATFVLKSKNHYAHKVTVPEEALGFLKKLWEKCPFRVSTGGKVKKLVLCDGRFVHDLWLASKGVDMRDRKSHCLNHNWLDWTNDNVYVPTETKSGKSVAESEQRRFEHMSQAGQIDNRAPKGMQSSPLDLIDARVRGPERARKNAEAYADKVLAARYRNKKTGEDEGVAWAFEDAAKMPPQRCAGEYIEYNGEDSDGESLPSVYWTKPRSDYHKPAGWESKKKRDLEDV